MKQRGFTFIEIIICLILLGIVGIFIGQAIYRVVNSYVFARANVQLTEKVQLALTRMSLELQYANSVKSAIANKLVYTTTKDDSGGGTLHTLEITSENLLLDNHILLGGLAGGTSFSYRNNENATWNAGDPLRDLAYVDIEIKVRHPTTSGFSFQPSINIRNNGVVNAAAPI